MGVDFSSSTYFAWAPDELEGKCVTEWMSTWEEAPWDAEEIKDDVGGCIDGFIQTTTHGISGLRPPSLGGTPKEFGERFNAYRAEMVKHPIHRVGYATEGSCLSGFVKYSVVFCKYPPQIDEVELAIETLRHFAECAGFYEALGRPFRRDDVKIRTFDLIS